MTNKSAIVIIKAMITTHKSLEAQGINSDVPFDEESIEALNVAIDSLKREPNIHARWEETSDPIDSKYGKHNYACPKCFRDPLYFVGGTEDWWCIYKPQFCPNCGADMREPKGEKGTQ